MFIVKGHKILWGDTGKRLEKVCKGFRKISEGLQRVPEKFLHMKNLILLITYD
jgi:hypothetical protein